ncbi:hypothetical protein LTR37_017892 [Vermiconidia calcicola]|uniref:Uncharacterized protein n=1 Tax=Vermiconidia calcicola TaxID=1690605 RepID=A0ACC3MJW1_9PEZI|nr:hypothetical protein LTR37_017892 [Vermiconidia calcicola]
MANAPKFSGSSLWLVPPEDSQLYKAIDQLIKTTIPSLYPIAIPPQFTPHITLTADTLSAGSEEEAPQQRLDDLNLSGLDNFKVTIGEVTVGSIFFQKLTMQCKRTPGLCKLAAYCRGVGLQNEQEAREWVEKEYRPHASLMYSDLPEHEIQAKLDDVKAKISEAKQGAASAKGGAIWLVPTFKDVDDWQPVAKRELPDMEWSWGM